METEYNTMIAKLRSLEDGITRLKNRIQKQDQWIDDLLNESNLQELYSEVINTCDLMEHIEKKHKARWC